MTAGDSYAILLSLSDYPASSGWGVKLAIAGAVVAEYTSASNGDLHALSLSTSQTAALDAGSYQYRVRAIKGSEAVTVETGILTVFADLATLAPNDALSWEEKTLAVVEEALNSTLSGEMRRYMIAGRQVETFSIDELLTLRNTLKAQIQTRTFRMFGTPVRFDVVGMR